MAGALADGIAVIWCLLASGTEGALRVNISVNGTAFGT